MDYTLKPIAHIKSDFSSKFGIPRQSGLAEAVHSQIIFEKEFRNPDILRGLDGYSHIWLIWGFSENMDKPWTPTVRPPRLGGNTRVGVFATRAPFRPNAIGLSSVKLTEIRFDSSLGPVITVSGADLMDGTPIYDIKPYITTDCHPDAICGFQEKTKDYRLSVNFPEALLLQIPEELRDGLVETLAQDPRPSYQKDPDRVYGFPFGDFDVKFKVADGALTVVNLEILK